MSGLTSPPLSPHHPLIRTHSHSITLSITHSCVHTLTLSLCLSPTHMYTLSLSLSITHSCVHTLTLSLYHPLMRTHSHSLSLSPTHAYTLSLSITHSYVHTLTLSIYHCSYAILMLPLLFFLGMLCCLPWMLLTMGQPPAANGHYADDNPGATTEEISGISREHVCERENEGV
jgi:hypothetical protein